MKERNLDIHFCCFTSFLFINVKESISQLSYQSYSCQLKLEFAYEYKSSQISESIWGELIGSMEFIIKGIVYFIIIHKL